MIQEGVNVIRDLAQVAAPASKAAAFLMSPGFSLACSTAVAVKALAPSRSKAAAEVQRYRKR